MSNENILQPLIDQITALRKEAHDKKLTFAVTDKDDGFFSGQQKAYTKVITMLKLARVGRKD